MKYCCTNCNYIYDESLGDKEEGILPGTMFYDLGDYFGCPVCYEGAENFEIIKEEVNYIEKEDTNDFFEIEHFPIIKINGEKLTIKIGKNNKHLMEEQHFISSISICDEYGDLIEEKFLLPGAEPKVEFDFDNLDEFEIIVRCSFHGLWGFKVKG